MRLEMYIAVVGVAMQHVVIRRVIGSLAFLAVWTASPALLMAAESVTSTRSPGTRVRLALMHGVPEKWNLQANFKVFLDACEQAGPKKADILITPECWLDGYAAPDKGSSVQRLRGVAQDLGGSAYLTRVSEEARKHRMMICFGFTSLENGRIYNAAGLWNTDGRLIGVYHKTHLQTHDLQFSAGESIPVWPTPWGPVGIMICADRRWPETARTLRLQGAKLILNPTYGFTGDLNEAMMRTRSYENQCFIAFAHPKLSLVTGPDGRIVAKQESDKPGVLICDVDLSRAKEDNHLRDRRPELYTVITKRQR
jgi:predicted amidohydrolase